MQDELLKVTTELQTVRCLYLFLIIITVKNLQHLFSSFYKCLAVLKWIFCYFPCTPMKALKTYNQYHTDCLIAEGKLKEAERLEERHTGKSAELGLSQSVGQRRSSVKKMERLMEKVNERQQTVE